MGFGLTDEEIMLGEVAHGFLSGQNGIPKFRVLRDTKKTFAEDTWEEIKNMGWPGLSIEEKYGGTAMGVLAGCTIADSIGQNLTLIPFISSAILAAQVISLAGNTAQKANWLPRLSSGEEIAALAIEHVDISALQLDNDGLNLSGQTNQVIDGMSADWLFIVASYSDPDSRKKKTVLCRIELTQKGVTRTPLVSVDGRDIARVNLKNVAVDSENILGDQPIIPDTLDQILANGALIYAAEQVGSARAAFEITLNYLKERKQFGKIIGSFQALQHRTAILYSELSMAEALIIKAAGLLEAGAPEAVRYCSLAKAKAGQAARLITNEAIQLHGGIGMTDEYDVGLYMKRVAVSERLYGDYNFHADKAAHLAGY